MKLSYKICQGYKYPPFSISEKNREPSAKKNKLKFSKSLLSFPPSRSTFCNRSIYRYTISVPTDKQCLRTSVADPDPDLLSTKTPHVVQIFSF